jgi:anti-sigma B factor antagonist
MQQGLFRSPGKSARPFEISSDRTNGSHRVSLRGEMDISVTDAVDREVRLAEASDATSIVIDLNRLEFMDASGIRLLLNLDSRSRSNGGRLRVTRATHPQVLRVLELTGVDRLLPFVE